MFEDRKQILILFFDVLYSRFHFSEKKLKELKVLWKIQTKNVYMNFSLSSIVVEKIAKKTAKILCL